MLPRPVNLQPPTLPSWSLPEGALRILQISDSHLYSDPGGRLGGLNTLDTFDAVLELAATRLPSSDLILATGDLVHDASDQGYQRVRERFEQFGLPVFCLPGNHDLPAVMGKHLNSSGPVSAVKTIVRSNWLIVMLDSTLPGKESGHLDAAELEYLDTALKEHTGHHALVCLHHHPVVINSAWMDSMALDNPPDFFEVIDRYPLVSGVLWGHIHQEFEAERMGVRMMGSPSTCIQFTPGQDKFGIDQTPPGLRWLELMPNGTIRSSVERLTATPVELDLRSTGY